MFDRNLDSGNFAANEVVEKFVHQVNLDKNEKRRIFLVGDSTVSPFNDEYFIPRNGYGMKMQEFIRESEAEVVNLAISGRSSKSFLEERNYSVLKEFIKAGDYLIIGFGHNDEKLEEERYSNANLSKNEKGAFKNFLFENYVQMARCAGAVPVLCTPIVRRSPEGKYFGAFVHVTEDKNGFAGGDYPKAIRMLAAEEGVLLVDLTLMTKCFYERIGVEESGKLHAAKVEGEIDNSHLNEKGACVVAKMVCEDIARKDCIFAGLLK